MLCIPIACAILSQDLFHVINMETYLYYDLHWQLVGAVCQCNAGKSDAFIALESRDFLPILTYTENMIYYKLQRL